VKERLRERGDRCLRLIEFSKRGAKVAERGGKRRHQIGCALKGVAGAFRVVAREPEFACFVVSRLPVRCKLERLVERPLRTSDITSFATVACLSQELHNRKHGDVRRLKGSERLKLLRVLCVLRPSTVLRPPRARVEGRGEYFRQLEKSPRATPGKRFRRVVHQLVTIRRSHDAITVAEHVAPFL